MSQWMTQWLPGHVARNARGCVGVAVAQAGAAAILRLAVARSLCMAAWGVAAPCARDRRAPNASLGFLDFSNLS
jgi:hypothetical protein